MKALCDVPRLMVAGVASGTGKTTFMVGLCRALSRRGLRVTAFKTGPDYLDPTYHARATGSRSQNLDAWMMGKEAVLSTFAAATSESDIALIEGVMGLFDGVSPTSEEGSSAQLAKWLGAPVLLAVDASGMARTLAAIAHGFSTFDPELRIAGLLANRVGSRSHLNLLAEAVSAPPILGGLPKNASLSFPERHLGLLTADEHTLTSSQLDALADAVEEWCDLDRIIETAKTAEALSFESGNALATMGTSSRCRIGYALDEAFHFYYEDNLRRLRELGAELIAFSPVHDASLPDVDGLYIGGGYPEVCAEALSTNAPMREAVVMFANAGGPVYAECGGLMYLSKGIRMQDGTLHAMVGLIPAEAVMRDKLQALGYVEVETTATTILGKAGQRLRGHQFRYSELRGVSEIATHAYHVKKRRNGALETEGYTRGSNVLASYIHAHWASNPEVAAGLVDACAAYAERRLHPADGPASHQKVAPPERKVS